MKISIPQLASQKGWFMVRYIHIQNKIWALEFWKGSIDGDFQDFKGYVKLSDVEKEARKWLDAQDDAKC